MFVQVCVMSEGNDVFFFSAVKLHSEGRDDELEAASLYTTPNGIVTVTFHETTTM